jgi:hypothetical protein
LGVYCRRGAELLPGEASAWNLKTCGNHYGETINVPFFILPVPLRRLANRPAQDQHPYRPIAMKIRADDYSP